MPQQAGVIKRFDEVGYPEYWLTLAADSTALTHIATVSSMHDLACPLAPLR